MSDGGRERTREEFAKLLSDTAFTLVKTVVDKLPTQHFRSPSRLVMSAACERAAAQVRAPSCRSEATGLDAG